MEKPASLFTGFSDEDTRSCQSSLQTVQWSWDSWTIANRHDEQQKSSSEDHPKYGFQSLDSKPFEMIEEKLKIEPLKSFRENCQAGSPFQVDTINVLTNHTQSLENWAVQGIPLVCTWRCHSLTIGYSLTTGHPLNALSANHLQIADRNQIKVRSYRSCCRQNSQKILTRSAEGSQSFRDQPRRTTTAVMASEFWKLHKFSWFSCSRLSKGFSFSIKQVNRVLNSTQLVALGQFGLPE